MHRRCFGLTFVLLRSSEAKLGLTSLLTTTAPALMSCTDGLVGSGSARQVSFQGAYFHSWVHTWIQTSRKAPRSDARCKHMPTTQKVLLLFQLRLDKCARSAPAIPHVAVLPRHCMHFSASAAGGLRIGGENVLSAGLEIQNCALRLYQPQIWLPHLHTALQTFLGRFLRCFETHLLTLFFFLMQIQCLCSNRCEVPGSSMKVVAPSPMSCPQQVEHHYQLQ